MIVTDIATCKEKMSQAGWDLFCLHQADVKNFPNEWAGSEQVAFSRVEILQYEYNQVSKTMPDNTKPVAFSGQIVINDELARYIFSVITENNTVKIQLSYLDTDDFQWSAYEPSATRRKEILIPEDIQKQALSELNKRIQFI
jgi:hypothetical protein